MKQTGKKKPVSTTPKGVWEGSTQSKGKHKSKKKHTEGTTTDIQENGYPTNSTQDK